MYTPYTHTHSHSHVLTHSDTLNYIYEHLRSQALTRSHTDSHMNSHPHRLSHNHTLKHKHSHTHIHAFIHVHSDTHTLSLACTHTRKFNRGSGTCIFELPFLPLVHIQGVFPFGRLGTHSSLLQNFLPTVSRAGPVQGEHGESPRWARPVLSHSLSLMALHVAPLGQGLY